MDLHRLVDYPDGDGEMRSPWTVCVDQKRKFWVLPWAPIYNLTRDSIDMAPRPWESVMSVHIYIMAREPNWIAEAMSILNAQPPGHSVDSSAEEKVLDHPISWMWEISMLLLYVGRQILNIVSVLDRHLDHMALLFMVPRDLPPVIMHTILAPVTSTIPLIMNRQDWLFNRLSLE